jgi:hypothetical protein
MPKTNSPMGGVFSKISVGGNAIVANTYFVVII